MPITHAIFECVADDSMTVIDDHTRKANVDTVLDTFTEQLCHHGDRAMLVDADNRRVYTVAHSVSVPDLDAVWAAIEAFEQAR